MIRVVVLELPGPSLAQTKGRDLLGSVHESFIFAGLAVWLLPVALVFSFPLRGCLSPKSLALAGLSSSSSAYPRPGSRLRADQGSGSDGANKSA
jgi:hypothetical protein